LDPKVDPPSGATTPTSVAGISLHHTLHRQGSVIELSFIRWDEKAGLLRDAIRSQMFDVLKAQEKETGCEEE